MFIKEVWVVTLLPGNHDEDYPLDDAYVSAYDSEESAKRAVRQALLARVPDTVANSMMLDWGLDAPGITIEHAEFSLRCAKLNVYRTGFKALSLKEGDDAL